MTKEFDVECVAAECEHLVTAIDLASRHSLPDWTAHRFAVVRAEAAGLAREIASCREEAAP